MVLQIPDAGFQLESSPKAMAGLPMQAFALTLSDSMLEDMIACVQDGKDIKLSLGNNPTLIYGSSKHQLPRNGDFQPYDLFLTDPAESSRIAEKLPNPTMSLFKKPELANLYAGERGRAGVSPAGRKAESGLDADIAALQNSLAQASADKIENSTAVLEGPPPSSKRGTNGLKVGKKSLASKTASYSSSTTRSLPTSPALSAIGSPSLGPTSMSQQAAEKTKQARSPIIHELAFREQNYESLWNKYPGSSEDEFKAALDKVAELDKESKKYMLKKLYWKELDVWNHEYASTEERQQAIDNAVRQYDRMRLTASEPEWDRLLPREERGKGKCLSVKQATIARGPPAPKIKVQRAEDSGAESSSNKDEGEDKSKMAKGGEAMVRSSSQPLPAKTKKISEREAQAKRLLSNKKGPVAKPSPKTSPTKPATKATEASNNNKPGKFKSKEFITDSDSSDEEAPLSATVPLSKPSKPTAEKKVERPVKEAQPAKARPAEKEVTKGPLKKPAREQIREPVREPVKAPARDTARENSRDPIRAPAKEPLRQRVVSKPQPIKRARDDDDSSSSSGTPLSKRFKTKEIKVAPPVQSYKHRPSDASQNSRGTSSGASLNKSKNTSPAKSSPLASSPPTNASDFEQGDERIVVGKKRKTDSDADSRAKRQRLSQDLVNKALKFKLCYEKYEALHREMVGLDNPPNDKLDDLLDMRQRLQQMKKEIYREVPPER